MTESILWLRPPFDPAELRAYAAKQEWRLAHEWPRTHANASELEWRAGGDTVIY